MNIIGRLTHNAEVRTLNNDKQVVNFSLAVNDSYRNKEGERIQQTTYFDCAYWRNVNVSRILTKGALVELTGRVSARAWTGKDGQMKSGLNFHASQIKFHSSMRSSESGDNTLHAMNTTQQEQNEVADLPF
ncbi:single-stranded DNA-binding protein [Niabella ginsengisoli]|uniref:Single-stranded DNA-binding protein n=1 Tax=Niabella ginsengisoli TaxID=522298 RepID=A0ABS9SMK2_9BACT|nr:single-stranded DNA-binding protein [Niabella ginsengisoli]MCH5599496.1 single-stranded DNA-binding protein [Niabella ginsengisoli]